MPRRTSQPTTQPPTPIALTHLMAQLAITSGAERVLDWGVRDDEFHERATRRAVDLRRTSDALRIEGIAIRPAGFLTSLVAASILDVPAGPFYDAIVGNAAFTRLRGLDPQLAAAALRQAAEAGTRISANASTWAFNLAHAVRLLKPGGRLAVILPAELLSVTYADTVRRLLLESFGHLQLVMFDRRIFPGFQLDAVLLCARGFGEGPAPHIKFTRAVLPEDLGTARTRTSSWRPVDAGASWAPGLLPDHTRDALDAISARFEALSVWGRVASGPISGNNGFFALSDDRVRSLGLAETDVVPVSPPGRSLHLRALSFGEDEFARERRQGGAVHLFRPRVSPSPGAWDLIREGEELEVHRSYKLRQRSPWWRMPPLPVPDLLLTYMSSDSPRLVVNDAGVTHLNSTHGLHLTQERQHLGRKLLSVAALNSITQLAAEVTGRPAGGGVLKLEPRDFARLVVPTAEQAAGVGSELEAIRVQYPGEIRGHALDEITTKVDEVMLGRALGLDADTVGSLREGISVLRSRRLGRAKARDVVGEA